MAWTQMCAHKLPHVTGFPCLLHPPATLHLSISCSFTSPLSPTSASSQYQRRRRNDMLRVGKWPRPDLHDFEGFMKSDHATQTQVPKLHVLKFRGLSPWLPGQSVERGNALTGPTDCTGVFQHPLQTTARPFQLCESIFTSQRSPSNVSPLSTNLWKRNCQEDYSTLSSPPGRAGQVTGEKWSKLLHD